MNGGSGGNQHLAKSPGRRVKTKVKERKKKRKDQSGKKRSDGR